MRRIMTANRRAWQKEKAGERMREEEWNATVRNHPEWGGANYKPPTKRKLSRRGIHMKHGAIRVHVVSEDAYTETQVNDDIKDGDVIVDKGSKAIAILMRAWPIAITQYTGEFHALEKGQDWAAFESGEYMRSYRIALKLARNFGWPVRRQGVAGDMTGRRKGKWKLSAKDRAFNRRAGRRTNDVGPKRAIQAAKSAVKRWFPRSGYYPTGISRQTTNTEYVVAFETDIGTRMVVRVNRLTGKVRDQRNKQMRAKYARKSTKKSSTKKARNLKAARSFGKLAKGQGWKWDRKIQAYRRVSRDMSSELRGYSLQALGRMLRRALNQGDEHKARLIEQEIDRRSHR